MTVRMPRQRSGDHLQAVRNGLVDMWRAAGLTEEQIQDCLNHLVMRDNHDGTVTVSWDSANWRLR